MSRDLEVQVNGFAAESQEAGRRVYEARMRPRPGSRAWRAEIWPPQDSAGSASERGNGKYGDAGAPTAARSRSHAGLRRGQTTVVWGDTVGSCADRKRLGGGIIQSWCILCGLENEKHEWKQIISEKKKHQNQF